MLHKLIIIISIALLIWYLYIYAPQVGPIYKKFVLAYIVPICFFTFFFSYNCMLTYFHKKGAFTSEQAMDFYRICSKSGIFFVGDTDMEKAKDIYFSIFGTDKYLGEGTLLSHMTDVYNVGKEITEKQ